MDLKMIYFLLNQFHFNKQNCKIYFSLSCLSSIFFIHPSSKVKLLFLNFFFFFSMVFMLLSILMVILLHFGYSKVEILFGPKGDTLTLRAFINALAFDLVLIIISPLMLLYSSKDLRKSIHVKFKKMK